MASRANLKSPIELIASQLMVCFVITTNILLLSALIAILSQSLTKVFYTHTWVASRALKEEGTLRSERAVRQFAN